MLQYFQASLIAATGAVGFYFVMVMGMFDFSIGANIMLSAIVGCVLATRFNMGFWTDNRLYRNRCNCRTVERDILCKTQNPFNDRYDRSQSYL